MKTLYRIVCHLLFWGWNALFLGYISFLFLPLVAPFLLMAAIDGLLPLDFVFTLVALLLVPLVSTWIGFRHFRKQPAKLMQLFYGVEAPLFVLCLVRLFLLREVTPAGFQILGSIGICILAFLTTLIGGYATRQPKLAWAQLLTHSLMLLVGVYAGMLLLFYAVPLVVYLVRELFSFTWISRWLTYPEAFWGMILLFVSGSLFVALPPAMIALYLNFGRNVLNAFAAQYGQKRAIAGALGVVAASFTLFVGLQQQPQVEAFARLQASVQTEQARQELLAKSETIRKGLVNAYLWSYRYISSHASNNHIQVMYQGLGVPGVWAQSLQATYNSLMSPFLYQGSSADPERAAKLYAEFFDAPIQRAEQAAINHALQSTHNREEAKAGLLNLNQRQVWLRSQQINVEEHDDWAEIELYEVYENQTNENQEILYYFSLPESAVVTGVWLGDTGDRQKRFPYVVAPRGAAQKVYNQQVQRQVDPALLEQVGPRHYRLRAFPIPPKLRIGERLQPDQTRPLEMHLWLTYKVLRQEQGWALPSLAEKRNLYWTNATERLRNGKSVQVSDTWVEPFLAATSSTAPQPHTANLANGTQVIAQPLSETAYVLPQNQRFAVILDTSRSMGSQEQAVKQTFDWLKQQGFTNGRLEDNEADLYLPAIAGAIPQRIDSIDQFQPDNVTFFGMLQPKEMLRQFDQLRGSTAYNGILLITDAGSYELANDKKDLPKITAPLWFVHLGAFSPAYDDATLQAIQTSGGGVGTQISEVVRRLSTQVALGEKTVTVVDGYAWQVNTIAPTNSQAPPVTSKPTGFEPIAARQLVLGLGRQQDLNQLENLDAIHAIAKTYPMVTPYSSMLVLVNDEQRAALKRAEAERDRFDRTVESGNEELTQPFNPMEAVPSPSTVGAIMMAAIGLLLTRRQRRRVRQL